jgi:hypothetical protein
MMAIVHDLAEAQGWHNEEQEVTHLLKPTSQSAILHRRRVYQRQKKRDWKKCV